jgi:hypothetical protein
MCIYVHIYVCVYAYTYVDTSEVGLYSNCLSVGMKQVCESILLNLALKILKGQQQVALFNNDCQ